MARRRTSRRRRHSVRSNRRRHSRRVSMNRRHRRRGGLKANMRRLARNLFGTDVVSDVAVPLLAAAGGFVAARYAGNQLAERGMISSDPRMTKLVAAGVGIPLVLVAARSAPGGIISKNMHWLALGLGLAPAEAYLRDTPLLGGSGAAAQLMPAPMPAPSDGSAPAATSGLNDYYTEGMLGLNGDPADQSRVDTTMDAMESVSTVTPTDLAMRAHNMPEVAPVTEPFASGDRGYAGGLFSRHLFSGMLAG